MADAGSLGGNLALVIGLLAAFGALAALHRYGVACPDDLSLVGYDDAPAAALTSAS